MLKIVPQSQTSTPSPHNEKLAVVHATFKEAVVYTFAQQVSMTVSPEDITNDTQKVMNEAQIHVLASIGITCSLLNGEANLAFPKDSFLKLANEMLGTDFTEISAENMDLCGELLNMLFGVAKAKLKDKDGIPVEKALPFVVQGSDLKFHAKSNEPTVVTRFTGPFGIFYLGVTVGLCDTNK